MADDHSKAGDELKAIAQRKNVAMPSDLSAKDPCSDDPPLKPLRRRVR